MRNIKRRSVAVAVTPIAALGLLAAGADVASASSSGGGHSACGCSYDDYKYKWYDGDDGDVIIVSFIGNA